MPRKARIKDDFGIYYLSQLSVEERDLFLEDKDRDKFLSILETIKNQFNVKIYAYCISHPNEYHLIMNVNGSDISKIMKAINISYAMYVNYKQTLYKDRYKSKLITDHTSLMEAIYEIHSRKVDSDENYNSCCFYNEKGLVQTGLLNPEDIKILDENSIFIQKKESCNTCITSYKELENFLMEYSNRINISLETLFKMKEKRNELIVKIRRESTLSLKDIGQAFGGLSESTISKIISHS